MTHSKYSALELTSLLLICRLARFFCCDTPYSAAFARGIFVTGILQAALLLPIFLRKQPWVTPRITRWLVRGFALLLGAEAAADIYRFLCDADAPHPALTLMLLLLTVLYVVSLPRPAIYHAAVFILVAAAIAFLLLPLGGLSSARLVSLWTQSTETHGFLQEWALSAELALIPMLCEAQPQAGKRAAVAWIAVRSILLPLVVLFGTMQCGRLQAWRNNPFLLLLARVPFSDALRTDGLWLMLAIACGLLAVAFLMGCFCGGDLRTAPHMRFAGFLPLIALTILFIMRNCNEILLGSMSLGLTLLQWVCPRSIPPRKEQQ